MKPTRIRHLLTTREGVTCPDLPSPFQILGDNEIGVVYNNTNSLTGVDWDSLLLLEEENAIPDPRRCGAGQGSKCCVFLTCGAKGFECERHTSLRWNLIMKPNMVSQRKPTAPYPACMSEGA